jgi:DsbC/DsbD-like thiol-disulfide interchange protein
MRRFLSRTRVLTCLLLGLPALNPVFGFTQENSLIQLVHFLSRDKVKPGDSFKVAVEVSIAPGYHINGAETADPYLLPTELVFDPQPGLTVEEYSFPAPRTAKFSFSEAELTIYEGKIIIGVLLRAGKDLSLGPHKIKGKLIFQACNSLTCLPPDEAPVDVPFDVVALSGRTKSTHEEIFSKLEFKKEEKQAP